MRVINNHTAPLGLPGAPTALGGCELAPGANDVDDAIWSKAKMSEQVQSWIKAGTVVEETPAETPKSRKA